MSEFTKVYKKWHAENNGKYDSARVYHKALMCNFIDWQPPKPLVVVPQCVADWFNINQDDINGNIIALTRNISRKLKIEWSEMDRWVMYSPNKPIETLIRMKLDGYMVEKEQMFYLKNVMTNNYLMQHKLDFRFGESDSKEDSPHWQTKFNQSEIDKLNTGSYEQIPVEMSDNGI